MDAPRSAPPSQVPCALSLLGEVPGLQARWVAHGMRWLELRALSQLPLTTQPHVVVVDVLAGEPSLDELLGWLRRRQREPNLQQVHVALVADEATLMLSKVALAVSLGLTGLFVRPVASLALLRRLVALDLAPASVLADTPAPPGPGSASAAPLSEPPRTPPAGAMPPMPPTPLGLRPPKPPRSFTPLSVRAPSLPPMGARELRHPSSRPLTEPPSSPRGSSRGSVPPLSPSSRASALPVGHLSLELRGLLLDAEERAHFTEQEFTLPAPEEEVEAVLPRAVLDALDEALDDDESSDDLLGAPWGTPNLAPARELAPAETPARVRAGGAPDDRAFATEPTTSARALSSDAIRRLAGHASTPPSPPSSARGSERSPRPADTSPSERGTLSPPRRTAHAAGPHDDAPDSELDAPQPPTKASSPVLAPAVPPSSRRLETDRPLPPTVWTATPVADEPAPKRPAHTLTSAHAWAFTEATEPPSARNALPPPTSSTPAALTPRREHAPAPAAAPDRSPPAFAATLAQPPFSSEPSASESPPERAHGAAPFGDFRPEPPTHARPRPFAVGAPAPAVQPAPAEPTPAEPAPRRSVRPAAPGPLDALQLEHDFADPSAPLRALAHAAAYGFDGALQFRSEDGVRVVRFSRGDVVCAASHVAGESLTDYLAVRGEMSREKAARLALRVPASGRFAAAALVAAGVVAQDAMWDVLRSHSVYVLDAIARMQEGSHAPLLELGRLADEATVFGASTGAEVVMDAVRRTVSAGEAQRRLGPIHGRAVFGPQRALLAECSLSTEDRALMSRIEGERIEGLRAERGDELLVLLYGLSLLDVVQLIPSLEPSTPAPAPQPAHDPADDQALRQHILARAALVDEGDYFALLGVHREATGFEIRRAYLELRARFALPEALRPSTLDLREALERIALVLEEAYEILGDELRRARYLRALQLPPR